MSDLSAVSTYVTACRDNGVKKPNQALVKFFREEEPIATEIDVLDLSKTYVGNRGILALCDVIKSRLTGLRTLSIPNQKLYNADLSEDSVKGNATVDRVVDVLLQHPSITALDVSSNLISNYAGRKLLALAQLNPRMCRIDVSDTRIDIPLRQRLRQQCEKNAQTLWEVKGTDAGGAAGQQSAADRMFGVFGDLSGFLPDNGAPGGNSSGAGGAAPNSARRAMQRSVPDLTTLGAGSARRKTVVGQGLDPEAARRYVAPVHEKSEADIGMIVQLLSENVLFSFLATKELRTIALAMVRAVFPYNADLMVQGGQNDALYVLQSGSCNILKDGQVVFTKTPGTGVGELELMYEAPCAATVRVATDEGCVAWRLDRETYRNLVMGSALRRREEYTAHLENVPFLSTLSRYEKLQIADALSTDEWQAGDYLIKMDEPGEWMFIILEGTVEVVGREHGVPKPICQFEAGHFIGELEFLNNHRTVADVIAKSATVRTAKLNRRHFEMCLGPVKDVLRRNTEHPKYEYYRKILEQQGGSPAKQH